MKPKQVTIGLKAKTGRAIAVVLSGPASSPEFVHRQELLLSDRRIAATLQPYHEVMELPWTDALIAVQPTIEAIQEIATTSLASLIRRIESLGFRVSSIAIVGAPDRRLERIGNPHIRAHAAEGVLFRQVLERAAKANRRQSCSFVDPKPELKRPAREVKNVLTNLGRKAGAPWRSDEKAAATASWIALSRSR